MDTEVILTLSQLLATMRENAEQLERAVRKNDKTRIDALKKEIIMLHNEVKKLI